jgi:hypothetical protein
MAGERFLLVARDLCIGEAGEIVEALVVLAHVIEAELEILALTHAAHGRAMRAGFLATVPLADRRTRLHLRLSIRADPDLLEIFGIGHPVSCAQARGLWALRSAIQELTFWRQWP